MLLQFINYYGSTCQYTQIQLNMKEPIHILRSIYATIGNLPLLIHSQVCGGILKFCTVYSHMCAYGAWNLAGCNIVAMQVCSMCQVVNINIYFLYCFLSYCSCLQQLARSRTIISQREPYNNLREKFIAQCVVYPCTQFSLCQHHPSLQ